MSKKKTAILIALFLGSLFLVLAGYVHYQMNRPQKESQKKEVMVKIAPGTEFAEIKNKLQKKGLLHSPYLFSLWAQITGKSSRIQAGEFRLSTTWSQTRILDHLVSGQEVLYKLRIPEGYTWWETADIVEESGLCSSKKFTQAITDTNFLRELDIHASTPEGFLFPDTYLLPKRKENNARLVLSTLIRRFWETTEGMWEGMDFSDIRAKVTLASMVEKETSQEGERRKIAGVLKNRLQKGMRLQCDPTVIYGIGPEFGGNLRKKHLLDRSNPYNTYRHSGRPPGPICSPGLKSLKAAMDPQEHKYLYYVSQGNGTHKFSRTLREHNRAVRRYLLRR